MILLILANFHELVMILGWLRGYFIGKRLGRSSILRHEMGVRVVHRLPILIRSSKLDFSEWATLVCGMTHLGGYKCLA